MPTIDPKSKLGVFVSHVLPGVMRPMRMLWHEVFGFIFLVIAIIMGFGTFRSLGTPQATPGRLMIAVPFVEQIQQGKQKMSACLSSSNKTG